MSAGELYPVFAYNGAAEEVAPDIAVENLLLTLSLRSGRTIASIIFLASIDICRQGKRLRCPPPGKRLICAQARRIACDLRAEKAYRTSYCLYSRRCRQKDVVATCRRDTVVARGADSRIAVDYAHPLVGEGIESQISAFVRGAVVDSISSMSGHGL